MNKVTNYVMQLIRTYTPMGVGLVLGWLSRKTGFIVDEQTEIAAVLFFTGILMAVYYFLVSLLEKFVLPRLGPISWLLLDFRKGNTAPVYPDAVEATVVPSAKEVASGAEVKPVS